MGEKEFSTCLRQRRALLSEALAVLTTYFLTNWRGGERKDYGGDPPAQLSQPGKSLRSACDTGMWGCRGLPTFPLTGVEQSMSSPPTKMKKGKQEVPVGFRESENWTLKLTEISLHLKGVLRAVLWKQYTFKHKTDPQINQGYFRDWRQGT